MHNYYVFLLVLCGSLGILGSKPTKQPHIVVIIGDDIGWNDFGFHGSNQIPTPNIDALGYNGVFLNNFYTQPTCSPSRAAFLTGQYPMRYGYQDIPISAGEDRPLPHDIELLPEKLKKVGYKTHLVGKWHLGAARKNDTPTARGFDTHFGYWYGFVGYFDYFNYQDMMADWNLNVTWSGLDLHDRFAPKWEYQGRYATDLFTEKSLQVIDNHNASEPLFLYLGHLAGHTGTNGTELGVPNITEAEEKYGYIEKPERRLYADIVNRLDESIGKVVKKLKEKDMLENSIILFLSDNGAQTYGMYQNYGSNYPLKGLKFTLLEGGVRGSAVLFSPLLEKKGYINNHLMHITDFYTTFLNVAGVELDKCSSSTDGINQWKSISKNLPSRRSNLLLNIDEINGFSGLISANGFKYLNGSFKNGIYDSAVGDPGRSVNTPEYNIEAVLQSETNKAIQSLSNSILLTQNNIMHLRGKLDISSCKGKIRTRDLPCLGECLFDILNDPCETTNLINERPVIANLLKIKLNHYFKQIVPSRRIKIDLSSNPKYCNNTWFPWLDEDGCYTENNYVYI
ncbi:unnamed protein product [Ceutorhynchus assimilis]|uniref:Sulfatase N-terminal domain-containing protein n=1 Tax=Ceutorhynchus assimilis TaxID=467358 RepID=A0A9P0DE90_9CUCU|nr:unnamed protein product [Ceutorhynchus assimilis]